MKNLSFFVKREVIFLKNASSINKNSRNKLFQDQKMYFKLEQNVQK